MVYKHISKAFSNKCITPLKFDFKKYTTENHIQRILKTNQKYGIRITTYGSIIR